MNDLREKLESVAENFFNAVLLVVGVILILLKFLVNSAGFATLIVLAIYKATGSAPENATIPYTLSVVFGIVMLATDLWNAY